MNLAIGYYGVTNKIPITHFSLKNVTVKINQYFFRYEVSKYDRLHSLQCRSGASRRR